MRARWAPVRALYTVGALARRMGIGRRRLTRLLALRHVAVYRVGRTLLVPLTEIEAKMPAVWESVRRADEENDGA